MADPTFLDLSRIEVEHGLAERDGGVGFVKIRCLTDQGKVVLGQVDPAIARELATDLNNVAARAEYEQDLWREAKANDMPDDILGSILGMVRFGEQRRHEGDPPD